MDFGLARDLPWILANVGPHVHVWIPTEVPDHGGAFNLPHIPGTVVANIAALEEGKMKIIKPIGLDVLHRFIRVLFAEGS